MLFSSTRLAALLLASALLAAGCDSQSNLIPIDCDAGPLVVVDSVVGSGQAVNLGSIVTVRSVGRLADGTVVDSTGSVPDQFALGGPPAPIGLRLGIGGTQAIPSAQVPEIAPMRLGGRRVITVPPNLGYGGLAFRDGAGRVIRNEDGTEAIPACSTLQFDVALLDAN